MDADQKSTFSYASGELYKFMEKWNEKRSVFWCKDIWKPMGSFPVMHIFHELFEGPFVCYLAWSQKYLWETWLAGGMEP